jgi:hypothetical protein
LSLQIIATIWQKRIKKNYPLVTKKNENSDSSETKDEVGGNGAEEAHKEKSPLTHDNLMAGNAQHKEKMSNITENNNDEPRETEKREIKFIPD